MSARPGPVQGGFCKVLTFLIVSWLVRPMAGQDDNHQDNNDGDDNTIVYSDENQNTIQNDNNSNEASVWSFCLPQQDLSGSEDHTSSSQSSISVWEIFPESILCSRLIHHRWKPGNSVPECPPPGGGSGGGKSWLFYKCFREVARMSLEAWDPTQPGCSLVSWWIKLIDYQSINQPEQAQCILDPASRGVRTHPVYLESSYEQSIRISTSRQNYKHSSGILSQLLRTNQPHTWEKYQEFFRN